MRDNDNINNDENLSDEEFFKAMAQLYSEQEGLELLQEAENLNNAGVPTRQLDRKVKKITLGNSTKRVVYRRSLTAAAACIALVFTIYGLQHMAPSNSASNAPAAPMAAAPATSMAPAAPQAAPSAAPAAPAQHYELVNLDKPVVTEASFVSTKLPEGYSLRSMAFDYGETIFYVENENNNNIVLSIVRSDGVFENDMYQSVEINNTEAYAILTTDYCLLEFEAEGLKYRLTSPYGYADLIEISKKFI